jgi:transposase
MTQTSVKENMKFIGIDISKHKLDVCFSDNKKISLTNSECGFSQLKKQLPRAEECLIVLEPTGGYEKCVIVSLQKSHYNVVLANALKVRRYAEAMGFLAKNDPIDSYVIKSFGEDLYPKGKLAVLIAKNVEFRQLEQWLGRSRQLVKLIATEKQRVEKASDKMIIKSMHRIIRHLEKELRQVEQKIEKISDKCQLSEQTNKYKTVKGIGDVCANALVTYLPELGSLNHGQVAALVGVAPYCHESGKSQGKNKIKGGRKTLRSLLYMATLSAIKHNPAIKVFYDRLMGKGKHHNVAMVACLRKLLCILNAMAKNGTMWQENYKVI